MPYNIQLADKIREYLLKFSIQTVEEKKMFRGLAFLVNQKLCVCVSGENLMCRFDPAMQEEIAGNPHYQPMIMRGKELTGYCYITPDGFKTQKQLAFWLDLCLQFNETAKSSKKKIKR